MSWLPARAAAPHGGELVERIPPPDRLADLKAKAASLPTLSVDRRVLSDLRMLGMGAYSPLTGFMGRADYHRVVHEMRLASGLVWPLPVTLPVSGDDAARLRGCGQVALAYRGRRVAVVDVEEVYRPDKNEEAFQVYGTTDTRHPGVQALLEQGDWYVAGPVTVLDLALEEEGDLAPYFLWPRQTRRLFRERGWRTVVAFQTRNPIHRAHEYLQKCALEMVDGLLIHPLAGATKEDDLDAPTRFRCYLRLIDGYFPKERVLLAAFPASMRYAGPREAVFHALCRKNYGCTHFIVGRDHAGVGSFYGTFDAQRIFDRFTPEELGIIPLKFDHAFYCRACGGMATARTCPHGSGSRVALSGTRVRELLRRGERLPEEFTRPEVAEVLLASAAQSRAGAGR
ncbi:MAG: sulfate adenylyltransferase [Firmicutes bacterium]|nr:sulfate adenylyltransferase [Bacillota bacterium]MBO2520798.1 sulfate adenylyltransferase [Bacillota bacterium]